MNELEKIFAEAYNYFLNKKFNESLGKLSDAETYYLEYINSDWKVSIENLKGFCYLGLNLIDDAQYCFEGALQIDEKSSQACAGLGEILYLKREEVKAKVMFEYALINNSSNPFAVKGLEKVNYILNLPGNHNSLQEAEEPEFPIESDFRAIIAEAGEYFSDANYLETVNSIQTVEGRIENDLVELASLLTELSIMKGMSFLNLDKKEEARAAFEKALNLTPDSSAACWGLAEVFYRCNLLNEAKTMFEWAVDNDPDNTAAREGLQKTIDSLENSGSSHSKNGRTLKLASGKIIELE